MPVTVKELEATPLGSTIDGLTEKTLREVFKSVCAKSDAAREEAESQLLVASDKKATADQATGAKESSASEKKVVPRYARCVDCKKDFDVTANTETSCRYHPVHDCEPDQDSPLYEDLDEWMEADTEENREEWPEYFIFECCGATLRDDPDGCVEDYHREAVPDNRLKRARVV